MRVHVSTPYSKAEIFSSLVYICILNVVLQSRCFIKSLLSLTIVHSRNNQAILFQIKSFQRRTAPVHDSVYIFGHTFDLFGINFHSKLFSGVTTLSGSVSVISDYQPVGPWRRII